MADKSIELNVRRLWSGLALLWRIAILAVLLIAFIGVGWFVISDVVVWFWGFIAHVWVDYAYTIAAVVAAWAVIYIGEHPGGWVQKRVFDSADNFAGVLARHDAWVVDRIQITPMPTAVERAAWAAVDADIARAAATNLMGKRIFCAILVAAFVLTAVLKVQA